MGGTLENGNGKRLNGHGRNGVAAGANEAQRRAARIVQVNASGPDDREKQRLRLIERLLASEGRVAISRAANDLRLAGFDFPRNQDVSCNCWNTMTKPWHAKPSSS